MRRATFAALLALTAGACNKGTPSSGTGSAAAPIVAPTPPADATKLTFAEGSGERKLQNFCEGNYQKLSTCFEDQQFWEILATIFFAQNPTMDDGTPRTRQMWIGMRKDDFAGLLREKRVAADCEASIRHSRWPTGPTIERVTKARGDKCPAFANAFGTMLFVDGAFSQAR